MAAPQIDRLCDPGQHEPLKGAIHGALLTLALVYGLYNLYAWRHRRVGRLGANAMLYGLIVGFEVGQVMRHTAR